MECPNNLDSIKRNTLQKVGDQTFVNSDHRMTMQLVIKYAYVICCIVVCCVIAYRKIINDQNDQSHIHRVDI